MTLKEFINQPNIIQLYSRYSQALANAVESTDYARLGRIVRGNYVVIYIDSAKVFEFSAAMGSSSEFFADAFGLLGRAAMEAAGIAKVREQPYLGLRGRGTLIGFIDTGLDYTKTAFQREDGTSRVRYIWDQTLEGKNPEGFLYGAEFTNEEINAALLEDTPFNLVPSTDAVGHGTFLASVAASSQDGEYLGAAPEADLIVVKLRRMHNFFYEFYVVPESQENAFLGTDIMLAIEYMIDKAAELDMPLSICIGLGSNMTGHDGFSNLEEYIASVSAMRGICICAAAGNESNGRRHLSGALRETNSTYNAEIRVPENADSFLAWIFVGAANLFSISVKSPLGEAIPRVVAVSGELTVRKLILENATVRVLYHFPVAQTGVELISVAIINPTPGIWTVTLHGDIVLNGKFNIWMHLAGLIFEGIEFLNPNPYTTIVVPATSQGCITCGAYNDKDNSLYINSSWGPTRTLLRKPDLVAPGVEVTGIRPMDNGTMTGTSVAAAITAGACALLLQWGIVEKNEVNLNTSRIKTYLIRGCKREVGVEYPDSKWGYGKLDLYNTFALLRSYK